MKFILKICLLIVMSISFSAFTTKDANDYVIEKVQKHDIIIFGEQHWITEQMNFFSDMIPELYKNGVKCFAFEFICVNVQDLTDSLIYNDTYDVELQNIILGQFPMFLRKPNENILYELWKLQQQIGIENEKIKVLALSTRPGNIERWLNDELDSLQQEQVKNYFYTYIKPIQQGYPEMNPDSLMAKFILDYYSETATKVAVYCGANHGLTKAHQYESIKRDGKFEAGEFMKRMGNILYDELPNKVTNIVFMPLPIDNGDEKECTTLLDELLEKQGINRIGFDLDLLLLEDYVCEDIISPRLLPYFSIKNYYDGAVYLKPRRELTYCSMDNEWLANLLPFYVNGMNVDIKKWEEDFHNAMPCDCGKNAEKM